mgnify:CR=1 FL=1
MPGYGCLCGGCRDCMEAQGYDPDRDQAEDDAIDVIERWLRDADKVAAVLAYLSEDDWAAIEAAVASCDAAALMREYQTRLARYMHDDAVDEALTDIRNRATDWELP